MVFEALTCSQMAVSVELMCWTKLCSTLKVIALVLGHSGHGDDESMTGLGDTSGLFQPLCFYEVRFM